MQVVFGLAVMACGRCVLAKGRPTPSDRELLRKTRLAMGVPGRTIGPAKHRAPGRQGDAKVMASEIETYRVAAYNTAKQSENKMHDDTVARRFGFSGGLVPGVDVMAY